MAESKKLQTWRLHRDRFRAREYLVHELPFVKERMQEFISTARPVFDDKDDTRPRFDPFITAHVWGKKVKLSIEEMKQIFQIITKEEMPDVFACPSYRTNDFYNSDDEAASEGSEPSVNQV